jgi:dTDP-4-amino-4,6-dideoxygalactose transaminase
MNIPLVDLNTQTLALADEMRAAIDTAMLRGDFILGREVGEFEKAFASLCGARHCVSVASGTDALHMACRVVGLQPGDEVLIPAMTFVATALGVSLAGAKPVLVDVDPDSCLLDLSKATVTAKTKAIMPVHLYGQCVSPSAFRSFAREHGLTLMEDAAQSHGATREGLTAGNIGTVAGFSFYPGKNLGAYGDGGAVTLSDDGMAERLRLLRNWGSIKKYHHEEVGLNSRLDTIQAAVLLVKMKRLAGWNNSRRAIAALYDRLLSGLPEVKLTKTDPGSVYHLYVIRVRGRDAVLKSLQDRGIGAGIHYPFPVHLLGAYKWLGYSKGDFPVAESWGESCLSLPIFPEMTEDQVGTVVGALKAALAGNP